MKPHIRVQPNAHKLQVCTGENKREGNRTILISKLRCRVAVWPEPGPFIRHKRLRVIPGQVTRVWMHRFCDIWGLERGDYMHRWCYTHWVGEAACRAVWTT